MPEEVFSQNLNSSPTTPRPVAPGPNNLVKYLLFGLLGLLLLGCIVSAIYWYIARRTPSVGEIPQNKRLVVLQSKGNALYSIDPSTKQKRKLFQLDSGATINEARVSPDGRKLYYIPSKLPNRPQSVVIVNNKREKREFDLAEGDSWALSPLGVLTGGMGQDCFWSPDGNKLACMLRKGSGAAGTGRDKIVILDYTSKDVSEIFNNDQAALPRGSGISSVFGGWVGNNKLLYVQTKENIVDIEPADFYTIDTETKAVKKEFSYPYDIGFKVATSPRGEEVFFQSFSRIEEDKFVKYDLRSERDTILASTKDVLGTTHPIISEDGSKLIFTTFALLKPLEEIAKLKPEELEGSGRTEIHIYDLTTGREEIIRVAEPIGYVETLLLDNKTFVVNKTPEGSILFDSETSNFEELSGSFIGFGYF